MKPFLFSILTLAMYGQPYAFASGSFGEAGLSIEVGGLRHANSLAAPSQPASIVFQHDSRVAEEIGRAMNAQRNSVALQAAACSGKVVTLIATDSLPVRSRFKNLARDLRCEKPSIQHLISTY